MNVTLIPLFLAASIGVKENDWKYGAEVIYDATVDSVSYPIDQTEKIVKFNMTLKLNCRSKSPLTLICKLHEPKLLISSTNTPAKFQTHEEEKFGDDYFELNFNVNGIEDIVVSSSINPSLLDMIKALVAQLNAGTDLSVIGPLNFAEVTENFTTGVCKTNYVFSSSPPHQNGSGTTKPYEIVIVLPDVRKFREHEIRGMQRKRNLDKCSYRADYFFGSREGQRAIPSGIEAKIESSKSHMIISKRNFTSWTENTIGIRNMANSDGTTLKERITLSLDKIIPATGPLPTITDPSTTSIFPGKWLIDDSSEEKSSSNETISFEENSSSEEKNNLEQMNFR